jgi:hypothetical protein
MFPPLSFLSSSDCLPTSACKYTSPDPIVIS